MLVEKNNQDYQFTSPTVDGAFVVKLTLTKAKVEKLNTISVALSASFPQRKLKPGTIRAAIGEKLRAGQAITWLPDVCGGYPTLAGSGSTDPLSLMLFALLPPVAAMNFLLLAIVLIAALGGQHGITLERKRIRHATQNCRVVLHDQDGRSRHCLLTPQP